MIQNFAKLGESREKSRGTKMRGKERTKGEHFGGLISLQNLGIINVQGVR